MDFTEFLDPAEKEQLEEEERERLEQEGMEKEEELARALADIERRRQEDEQEAERLESQTEEEKMREKMRGGKDPITSDQIFANVNARRASMAVGKHKGSDKSE